ncbi:MAG: hypothetical protein WCD69_27070 [Xanthobacteraceae bacterium]
MTNSFHGFVVRRAMPDERLEVPEQSSYGGYKERTLLTNQLGH